MNQSINLKRIGWLSKKEFFESYLPHFKTLSIVVGAIVLIRCIIEYFEPSNTNSVNTFNYEGIFVVFGFIYTISSFNELKLLPTRTDFLTLPASTAEKVFTKWFFNNVMYWVGIVVLFTLFFFIQKIIIGGFMGQPFDTYNLFSKTNLTSLHYLIVVFSVYFFGAAAFNTGAWYKVILWGIILSLAYITLIFIFAYALFPEFRAMLNGNNHINNNISIPVDLILEDFWVIKFAKFFILYLAAPFFWFMTYLKIKEKEV